MTEMVLHTNKEPVYSLARYNEDALSREQLALVWVVKKTVPRGHKCSLPGGGMLVTEDEMVNEDSVLQCLICASYWRLYLVGSYGIPNWEQVVPEGDTWRAVRSRFFKVRNISNGGGPIWPWRVDA